MWECGLKQKKYENAKEENTVTPYVGVWIETLSELCVWQASLSLLMWECGLKQDVYIGLSQETDVTPYVGVWIETIKVLVITFVAESLLMWECGLKQVTAALRTLDACHSLCGSVD